MDTLLNKAGKKLFEQHLQQYTPVDPLYEQYTDSKGRQKRRKRELPPGLSARDAAILKSVKRRAHYLDKGFRICGLRFGWTFFIGLIPVVGDVADASLNYILVVKKARTADIPDWLLQRMLVNNAISAGVGFVPFVGDVVLAMYKANSRNAALLEEFLRIRGEEFLKLGGAAEDPNARHGGLSMFKSKKAKESRVATADVEQVKPGAGMTAAEVKQVVNAPEPKYNVYNKGGTASTSAAPANYGATSAAANTTGKAVGKKSPSSPGSSGFSGFFSRKKTPPLAATGPEKGRFVENVQ